MSKWCGFFFFLVFAFIGNASGERDRDQDSSLRAYITAQDSYEILSFDLGTGAQEGTIPLDFPGKILALSEDGKNLYIACDNLCQIQHVATLTNAVKNVIHLDHELNQFVLSKNGEKMYLSYKELKSIDQLDLQSQALIKLVNLEVSPHCMVLDPIHNVLYVSGKNSKEILSIAIETLNIQSFLLLDVSIDGLAMNVDGTMLLVSHENPGQLTSIHCETKDIEVFNITDLNQSKIKTMGFNKAGTHAYIVQEDAQEIIPIELKSQQAESSVSIGKTIESIGFYPFSKPQVNFDVLAAVAGEETIFKSSHSSEESLYEWDFGDGLQGHSTDALMGHIYAASGEFTATLKVNASTAKKTFEIQEPVGILPRFTAGTGTQNSTTEGTPSESNITFGSSVTDNATVIGTFGSGTPTGTVTFFVGAQSVGSPVTLIAGPNNTATASSIPYTPATVGNYQFTAEYSGDSTYAASSDSSPTNAFTVSQVSSSTNLLTSINPSLFGQTITLTANVALTRSNGIPTGSVTFMDGSAILGTVNLISGSASFPISTLSVGSHSLTAVYNGDVNFSGSTSNLLTQTVNQGTTTTSLTSSVNPLIVGNSTTLSANITVASGGGTVTGTVTFKDGLTNLGTGTVSAGLATLNVSNLAVGTHNLTAIYSGDVDFTGSTSSPLSQVVNQGTTTSSLTSSVNPSTYGQATTFTATVAVNSGAGSPTGFFTFLNGTTVIGTVNLTGSSAALLVSNLPVGANSITVIYGGDLNFQTSTSPVLSQQVNQAIPIITLSSSENPSNYGEMVTFTCSVMSPTSLGFPTGTVTFFDGTTALGTSPLTQSGGNASTGSFELDSLSGGLNSIKAVYNGDANFALVSSAPLSQSVILANTITTIFSSSPNSTEFGQPVVLQANVVGSIASPPLSPTGMVTFFDGGVAIGTVPVSMLSSNAATATLTISTLAIGSHSLTAEYLGDINYNLSTSTPMTQKIIMAGTSNVTTTSGTPSVVGQLVTFTSTVSSKLPGMGNPLGTVQFYDGIHLLGTGTLAASTPTSSVATFQISSLILGSHSIVSAYLGDGNFSGSTAPAISQIVHQDQTTTVLSSSENPSNFGDNITLSAAVTANIPGSGIPTGIVTFSEGATVLGTGIVNSSGIATFSTIALYPGTHTLTATYSGDMNYVTSISMPLSQVVLNQLPTIPIITSSRNSSPVNQAVTYSATLTAITGIPTGTVTFFDNGVELGMGTLNAQGIATVTEPGGDLGLGTHVITASYGGDPNFIPSMSANFDQFVVPYDTVTVLVSMPNPSDQANAVFQATVTPSGTPTPIPTLTGTVTFFENGIAVSGPLSVPSNGVVTFTPNDLHFGTGIITAVYSGDHTTFAMSTSNPVTQHVQQTDMLQTSTTLTTSSSTAFTCQSVTLTATVREIQGFYIPTGSVTFYSDGSSLGSAILNNAGVATLSVSSLSLGVHSLTATYNSDSNYAFSVSNAITETIVANPTTTALSIIPNLASTPYGQLLTFVMQVQATNGTPTGVVDLTDENGEIVTLDLDSTGTAIYITSDLIVGVHNYTATYNPNCCSTTSCFLASTATLSHTITQIDSDLSLSASPSPTVYGNTITLTGLISSNTVGAPTGTVTFYNSQTLIGTAPIIEGSASITVENLPAGVVVFNATYNGDSNFIVQNFPSFQEIISKAPAAVSLTSFSKNPSVFGASITFSATVSSSISIPSGTVTFFSGTTNLGQVTLNGSGIATLQTSSLNLGTNAIRAVYSGNSNFLPATSSILNEVTTQAQTTTTVTSSLPNPSTFNSLVTVNVTVAPLSPGSGVPTGTVTGFYGSTVLGTATLNNSGVATFVTTILPAGTPTITAVYGGDANFLGSSGLATHTVNTAVTTIATISSSVNPSVFGQPVTLSTKVSSTAGVPGGIVSFFDGTQQIGIATLDSNGNSSLTVPAFAIGTHPITVKYSGSGSFTAVTSAVLNQIVNKAATTTTLNATISTSVYGESVVFTAVVSPVSPALGTPTGTVTFKNGSVTLGTVALSNGGTASFSTASLPANTNPYSITAVYSSDSNFNASTSPVFSLKVIPVSTITSAITSPNPSSIDQLVTLTVTVEPINTGVIIPDGVVTASYGSTVIGTGTLNTQGMITFLTSTLPAGTLPFIITYTGNSNFSASSTTVIQTVLQGGTTLALTSSLNPSHVGESIALTATVSSPLGTPTGTVSFFDGSSVIGAQTLNGGGVATLNTSALSLGAHNIIAVYSGDSNFSSSTSQTLVQNVVAGITTTALSSSVNPSAFGQATILTAAVNITTGAGVATGTVTFKDGSTILGTSSLSGGTASFTVSNLSKGAHTLTAVYSGDSNFSGSTSSTFTQNVVLASTATSLLSSLNPSAFGQTTLLTATLAVTTGNGNPTGTITFKDGSTTLGTGTVSNGQATLSVSSLSVGAHVLTAVYSGDTNFAPSTSSSLTQNVTVTTSTISLTSSVNPSVFDQNIVLTAIVPTGSAPVAPTGTITFKDGSIVIGTGTLSGGIATLNISSLGVGVHTLTAVYNGDGNFSSSTSQELSQIVNQGTTTTQLNSSINPSIFGNSITFTANVIPGVGSGIPTGTLIFKDGTTIIGSTTLSNGTGALTIATLETGSHSITAVYSGDADFAASTSNAVAQTVNQGNTSTSLTSSLNPSAFGQMITLTANIAVTTGVGTPTGSVTFIDGSNVIGTGTVTDGVATFITSTLSVGAHQLTAIYSGDNNFNTSTSAIWTQTINKAISTTNILAASPNPSMFGQNVTFFAAVTTPTGVPSGTVTFLDGTVTIETVPVYDGIAICSTQLLSIGSHLITARYNGDANFNPSTSTPPVVQVVNQTTITVTTVTTLSSSLNPSNFGQPVTFDVTVLPIAGGGIPTGIVTIYSGAIPLTTLTLDNTGHASYTTSTLPGGTSTLVALYSGDSNFSSSTATLAQQVNPIATSSLLSSSLNPSIFNETVIFSSTVTSTSGAIPTGSVTFSDGAEILGTTNLNNQGVAVFMTSSLSIGSHGITAVYNPDADFTSSTGTLTQIVNPAPLAAIIVSSSLNPAQLGQAVTFTAEVTASLSTPTGTVTFFDGTLALGTALLNNGTAQLTSATLSLGNHTITAVYNGDMAFAPATSPPLIEIITISLMPQIPQNFYGYQVVNKFFNEKEHVNILNWSPPQDSSEIVSYEIYRNPELTDLAGTVCNQFPFRFEDGKRKKHKIYTYYLVSVNKAGIRSSAISADVKPLGKCK